VRKVATDAVEDVRVGSSKPGRVSEGASIALYKLGKQKEEGEEEEEERKKEEKEREKEKRKEEKKNERKKRKKNLKTITQKGLSLISRARAPVDGLIGVADDGDVRKAGKEPHQAILDRARVLERSVGVRRADNDGSLLVHCPTEITHHFYVVLCTAQSSRRHRENGI
jgi:hypothetical protein